MNILSIILILLVLWGLYYVGKLRDEVKTEQKVAEVVSNIQKPKPPPIVFLFKKEKRMK